MRRPRLALLAAAALLMVGAAIAPLPRSAAQDEDPTAWLTEVARTYRRDFGRVDDELRWAPWLCRMPMPSQARVSRADDGPHGRKVYFVYASDRDGYLALTRGQRRRAPRGLTVVKEAFHPRTLPVDEETAEAALYRGLDLPSTQPPSERYAGARPGVGQVLARDAYRPMRDGDEIIGVGEPGGLYVMRYLGRRGRGTDRGWTYGTVAADGTVTAHGSIASCMGCHQSAPHDRLFGLDAAQ